MTIEIPHRKRLKKNFQSPDNEKDMGDGGDQTCAVACQNGVKTNKLPDELLDKTSHKFVFYNSIKVL